MAWPVERSPNKGCIQLLVPLLLGTEPPLGLGTEELHLALPRPLPHQHHGDCCYCPRGGGRERGGNKAWCPGSEGKVRGCEWVGQQGCQVERAGCEERRPGGCGPEMAVLGETGAAHKKETTHTPAENPSSISTKQREGERQIVTGTDDLRGVTTLKTQRKGQICMFCIIIFNCNMTLTSPVK